MKLLQVLLSMLYSHIIHIQLYTETINNNDERTHFFRKIYLSQFILERVAKGLMWVMCGRSVGDGTDCHILTPSSSDHRSTFSFCWAAQPGSWGPKPSVWRWRWLSLRHLVRNCDWNSNCNCNSNWTLPTSDPNCLKPSVAPGYIIDWPPHLLPVGVASAPNSTRPQVKVIFRNIRPDAPVSWLMARSKVNILQSSHTYFSKFHMWNFSSRPSPSLSHTHFTNNS